MDRQFEIYHNFLAASTVLDIHLPDGDGHRLSLTGASVYQTMGFGLGYAYQKDNIAMMIGYATSVNGKDDTQDHERIIKLGMSVQF